MKSKSEGRKSFIVTEAGIIETEDDNIKSSKSNKVDSRRSSVYPNAANDAQEKDAKTITAEDTEKMFKDFSSSQKKKGPSKMTFDDAKSKLRSLNMNEGSKQEEVDMRQLIRNAGNKPEVDEIKASFYNKKSDVLVSSFLASKAIAIMSTERKKREEYLEISGGGKGKLGSIAAVGKFKSKIGKQRDSKLALITKENDGTVNSHLLIGLGKFKKTILKKKKSQDDTSDKRHQTDETILETESKTLSVKGLAAAGKFKSRRYKKENSTKQTMGPFMSWFGGSQALERIIKLERMGVTDEKILMEINYMVKKVLNIHMYKTLIQSLV